MIETSKFSQLNRFLIGGASLGIIILVLQYFADLITVLIVALILGILFTPLLNWLKAKGLPSAAAFLLTMVLVILIMAGLLLFLIYSLGQLYATIPEYVEDLDNLTMQTEATLATWGIDLANIESLGTLLEPEFLIDVVGGILITTIDVLSAGITALLMLAFLLIGASSFASKANRLIDQANPGLSRLYKLNQDIRHYLLITNNVGLAVAAVNTILLAIIGVDFALLWGVLSYLLSYIPYIGFILALIPPALLALLEFGWPTAVLVIVAYVIVNSAVDDFIKPRLMGQGLDLAPVIVFVSVVFWGLILGPLGGLLAVPVTVAIKELVIEPDPDNRWIAELIGGDDEGEAAEIETAVP